MNFANLPVTCWLFAMAFVFCLVSFCGQVAIFSLSVSGAEWPLWVKFADLFNVEDEANFPTWFSSALLFCCSLLTLGCMGKADRPMTRRPWLLLALLFGFLSIDETAQIHENANAILRANLLSLGFNKAWDILSAVLALAAIALLWRFVFSLPASMRQPLVLGALCFGMGAVAIEMIGNEFAFYGKPNIAAKIVATSEEFLEMSGAIFWLRALMPPFLLLAAQNSVAPLADPSLYPKIRD